MVAPSRQVRRRLDREIAKAETAKEFGSAKHWRKILERRAG